MKKKLIALMLVAGLSTSSAIALSACETAHSHDYTDKTVTPTCTEQGYTLHSCECGYSFKDTYVNALGHDTESHSGQPKTCTDNGWNDYVTCKRDGCTYSTYEAIPAGHTPVTDKAVPNSCETDGLTEGSHCDVCNEVLIEQTVVPASHHVVQVGGCIASCTEEGITESAYCDVCNAVIVKQEVIPKLSHTVDGQNFCSFCQHDVSTDGLTSTLTSDGNGCKITSIGASAGATEVYVPTEIDGVPVTTIGYNAFGYNQDGRVANLKKVFLPDTITSIESGAFANNSAIEQIYIPDGIENVAYEAFNGCRNLKFNEYGGCKFLGNKNNPYLVLYKATNKKITTATIPQGTKIIVEGAFEDCNVLTSVTLSDTVKQIGNYAFYYCSLLSSVTLNDGLESIGELAFDSCTSLTSLVIPDSVTYMGPAFLSSCSKLKELTIPYIGENKDGTGNAMLGYAFKASGTPQNDGYVPGALTTLKITNATVLGKDALRSCKKIENVILCDTVTSIGANSFNGCLALKNVFFTGDAEKWNEIDISTTACLSTDKVLFYSQTQPLEGSGNYWHYTEDGPVAW